MRPVPADHQSFQVEWERHVEGVLELTPAAERALEMALHDRAAKLPFLPWWTRAAQPLVVTPLLRLTAVGGLPPTVRSRFGIPWGCDDEVQYRLLQAAVRELWRGLPAGLRYGPVAQAGWAARRQLSQRPAETDVA